MKKTLFFAIYIAQSSSDSLDYKPLYAESFILIKAISLEQAQEIALNYTKQEECSFKNEKGETITWSFKEIIDVNNILSENLEEEVTDLYTRHFRNYKAYCEFEPFLSKEDL